MSHQPGTQLGKPMMPGGVVRPTPSGQSLPAMPQLAHMAPTMPTQLGKPMWPPSQLGAPLGKPMAAKPQGPSSQLSISQSASSQLAASMGVQAQIAASMGMAMWPPPQQAMAVQPSTAANPNAHANPPAAKKSRGSGQTNKALPSLYTPVDVPRPPPASQTAPRQQSRQQQESSSRAQNAAEPSAAPSAPPVEQRPLAPVEATAKLVGLPGGCCPSLCHYVSELPLTLGRGAGHTQPWAFGDHCMLPGDPQLAALHATIEFEPLSRTYELTLHGAGQALVDGFVYSQGATMRLGSGSCVRLGDAEFCVLLPQAVPTATHVPSLPLPALPGAGLSTPPPVLPVQVAAQILKESPEATRSLGEIECEARRTYPYYVSTIQTHEQRETWRQQLDSAMQQHPTNFIQVASGVWKMLG